MSSPTDKALNKPYAEPSPIAPSTYQRDIYSAFRPPTISTKPAEWESQARTKVPLPNFNYVYGAASSGATHAANTAAFNRYRLRPAMLVNATLRDNSVTLFGRKLPTPMLAGPVGVQSIMHKDAEIATAKACKDTGVPMILSTASTRSIEEVAAANGDGERWYQLYWPRPQYEEITASLLRRARASGFRVLVVTLDTFNLAWRPMDLDEAYLPFLFGEGCQIGFSDPVFNRIYDEQVKADTRSPGEKMREALEVIGRPGSVFGALRMLKRAPTLRKSRAWLDVVNSGTYREWEHLKILTELWDGPIVLKGIQRVEDARKAVDFGMSGIVVSNHGGRQLDGAMASLDALAQIAADNKVKSSGLELLFDSGIRTGSDILKALALGAKGVLIGRPYMYGLAIDGEAGVKHVFKCLQADTDNMLGNLGKKNLQQLSREDLQLHQEAKL